MSGHVLRPIRGEETDAWATCVGTAFGRRQPDGMAELELLELGLDHTLAAFEGTELIGTAAWFPLELTMPGLRPVAAAGVIAVTVLPTHRRRGIMTGMMHRQLADLHRDGVPLALLTASEGGIYGRFGYCAVTQSCSYEIDRHRARLVAPAASAKGAVRLLTAGQAEEALPAVWDQARRGRAGEITLPEVFWREWFSHPSWFRLDTSQRFFVAYESDGEIEGCVEYQVVGAPPDRSIEITLFMAASLPAYAALWRYLLGVDLIQRLSWDHAAVDEPLRELLDDPRQLRATRLKDHLWARVLDLPAVLRGRAYSPAVAGSRLVFEVTDGLCPWNAGRYVIEVDGAGEAAVEVLPAGAGSPPELTLDARAAALLAFGGGSMQVLAYSGRIGENVPGAAWRADSIFGTGIQPFSTMGF